VASRIKRPAASRICGAFIAGALMWLAAGGVACAQDFVQQELTMKVISLVVGVIVIFAACLLLVYQLLWRVLKMEYDVATKFSIVTGVLLSYLWFVYTFGQVLNFMMMAAFGVIVVVILILLLLKRE
jgi:p-aminobenzoyl-glutamate transporter AbgT